ncbi:MAG TPA: hypothetical protein VD999_02380 [Vitreimonas sp.]|nr:hypothetical protein [Vitreimonas sp.]
MQINHHPQDKRIVASITELRENLFELVLRVHYEERIVLIKRHGKVIAMLRSYNVNPYRPRIPPWFIHKYGWK